MGGGGADVVLINYQLGMCVRIMRASSRPPLWPHTLVLSFKAYIQFF